MATQEPSPSGQDRRRHQRAQAEWPITVVLDDGKHEARIRDVSRSGLCFFLERPIQEMTLLELDFDLPVSDGLRRIHGQGAVVRCEKISATLEHYEIAVFMTEMADPDRDTIEGYVNTWRGTQPPVRH